MRLDVETHHQEENNYCGPACAQMIMQYRTRTDLPQQLDLFECYCHEPANAGLDSKPGGLHRTICCRVPAQLQLDPDPYQPRLFSDAPALSKTICHSISEHCEPATVMVYGVGHWLVVSGYEGDAFGKSGIKSFSLNDPADVGSSLLPGCKAYGLVTYDAWLKTKVNDIPTIIFYPKSDPAYVHLKESVDPFTHFSEDLWHAVAFIALLDDSPASGAASTCAHATTVWDLNPGNWAAHNADHPATAIFFSEAFPEIEPWHTFRQIGVEAVEAEPAQTIDYFDGNNGHVMFTAFRWSDSSGRPGIPMAMLWEGEQLLEATGTIEGSLYLADDLEMYQRPDDVYQRFEGTTFQFIDLDGANYQYTPTPSNFRYVTGLWWRHNTASSSPFLPFYRVYFPADSERPEHTFYVRLDGVVYADLFDAEGNILESGMVHPG